MGRIHVLSEQVANKIAAGEVVERPASVVKELLENALDAGARRIRVQAEAGGKKLIQISDDGCGMSRDDALLAFERHATSKIKDAEDLLSLATLGFRGEALPSIASVSRLTLETRAALNDAAADSATGTLIEISGGKIFRVEDAGLPAGTTISVRDLFFNTPARKKFLKAESTEMSQVASLVTHYALAHPDKHFELHSSTHTLLEAPPVASHAERIYQIFGKETLDQLLPLAATLPLQRTGLPEPPPWRRDENYRSPAPGELRLHGFVSRPEIQKLNRNSIFVFVNGRQIRDRLVQHAISDAYRNILPPTVFPVVLLFLEMPGEEVDVNVHPSKTEVRFRQSSQVHDLVRDSVRAALMKARPVPQFIQEITAQPHAAAAFTASAGSAEIAGEFALHAPPLPPQNAHLFSPGAPAISIEANAAQAMAMSQPGFAHPSAAPIGNGHSACGSASTDAQLEFESGENDLPPSLVSLVPLGQIRDSFIVAADPSGLWIIDQHVAHERILFEKLLRQQKLEQVQGQRLLMPLVIELTPGQQAAFVEIGEELRRNGFEVEPFGSRTLAIKSAPAGVDAGDVERLLHELLDHFEQEEQVTNLEKVRGQIAASIACHAAIKVNQPLEESKMRWLLSELARASCPMTCPHGRPVVLRYSVREIQRAFKRI
jgi:DNA mismatch repair protein MutL